MKDFIEENNIPCPVLRQARISPTSGKFNLMFKTFQGVTEDAKNTVYLRPETAQGIFVNFANVQRTTRRKLPFGVCQIGKSFRNEITPGNFIFRTREFEQMELEFFCKPGTDLEWFAYWKDFCQQLAAEHLGMKEENLRLRDHDPEELCLLLQRHHRLRVPLPLRLGRAVGRGGPHRLRPDAAPERLRQGSDLLRPGDQRALHPLCHRAVSGRRPRALAFLCDAYDEEVVGQDKNGKDDVRIVLRLHPALAPYKAAVLPLSQEARRAGHGDLQRAVQGLHGGLTTRPAPSASATAARTRSARPSASPWTSRPWATGRIPATTASPSGTGTPWSRCVFPSAS